MRRQLCLNLDQIPLFGRDSREGNFHFNRQRLRFTLPLRACCEVAGGGGAEARSPEGGTPVALLACHEMQVWAIIIQRGFVK